MAVFFWYGTVAAECGQAQNSQQNRDPADGQRYILLHQLGIDHKRQSQQVAQTQEVGRVIEMRRAKSLADLDQETRGEMMEFIQQACSVLSGIYHPEGFNVGLNLGSAAGAGLPIHLHWQIVPRWEGDTNYMTTFGGVGVIPEALEDTLEKVRTNWP